MSADKSRRRNRSYRKRSPLDKLPEPARKELRRLCQSETTLREIQAWLKSTHHCAVSQTTISAWNIRRLADESAEVQSGRLPAAAPVRFENFEIVVTAPGASEVRVQVRALAVGGEQ
jgi:hypothetical protein